MDGATCAPCALIFGGLAVGTRRIPTLYRLLVTMRDPRVLSVLDGTPAGLGIDEAVVVQADGILAGDTSSWRRTRWRR